MKKIVRLTESDLIRLVKRVIKENEGKVDCDKLVGSYLTSYGNIDPTKVPEKNDEKLNQLNNCKCIDSDKERKRTVILKKSLEG
jgi:hypothetical protein